MVFGHGVQWRKEDSESGEGVVSHGVGMVHKQQQKNDPARISAEAAGGATDAIIVAINKHGSSNILASILLNNTVCLIT